MINYEAQFYNIDYSKVVAKPWTNTSFDYANNNLISNPYPQNYTADINGTSQKVYKLNAATNTMANKSGLGIVLKVMAGDNINIFGKSYHKRPSGSGYTLFTNSMVVLDLINAFAVTSLISSKGVTGTQITGQPGFPTTMDALIGSQPSQTGGQPKAAINWIVLDEQFKYVSGGFDMVADAGTNTGGTLKTHDPSTIPTIAIPKNGYIYIYCSNESKYDVFFDNLQVVHNRSPLIEETHYYPFGLTMSGISSKALNFGQPQNKKKFTSQELDDDLGINLYQMKFRNHDPQIGRFIQIDPLGDKYVYNTTYAYAENRVIDGIDLEGLEWLSDEQLRDPNFNYRLYQETFRSESTNPNYQQRAKALTPKEFATGKYKAVGDDPAVTLKLSAGKQIGFEAGPVSLDYNGGSKDIFTATSNGTIELGKRNETTEGVNIQFGVVGYSGESVSVKETVKADKLPGVSYEVTTTTTTNAFSVGLKKTPLSLGLEATKVEETKFGETTLVSNTGFKPSMGGISLVPTADITTKNPTSKTPGTKLSLSLGIKLELGINLGKILESISN